ncbi:MULTISPECIES: hypothetical protein [Hymenobacter]|uniref:DUF4141 domain-containing protein n=1 Tax=Hymenobacter mucosus TaxID=1411120 RepID=A0A239AXU8_9BACT|nr:MULTISPECIES: hypothetical protein [Hymenobacter]MDF7815520.1 hypothetical protein [Hymenobacter sp. YC55]SNS00171.1 hypothetical protein SAMN06269173_11617 [Hymenobacter mucosus]
MNTFSKFFALALALGAHQAYAQLPAVISAPISEKISRKQIGHQTVSGTLLAQGKLLAADMKVVSGQIKGVIDKTQQLHDQWYSSLLQISSGVRTYRRVQEIYDRQAAMITLYANIMPELRNKGLDANQLAGATSMYGKMLNENIGLLSELVGVLSAGKAKMTDPERIEFINNIADKIEGQHDLMNYYTSKCRAVARVQAQTVQDKESVLALMGKK